MTCTVDGCTRADIQAKGWCRMHYHRWRRTGTTGEAGRRQRSKRADHCIVAGCTKPDKQVGYCTMHAARLRRHGDPHAVFKAALPYGPDHHAWQDVPSYGCAHHRVRLRRGSASQFACVDCGGRAQHWSYDHADPNELRGPAPGSAGYKGLMPYSADPDHYQPRCVRCHKAFDLQRSALDTRGDAPGGPGPDPLRSQSLRNTPGGGS